MKVQPPCSRSARGRAAWHSCTAPSAQDRLRRRCASAPVQEYRWRERWRSGFRGCLPSRRQRPAKRRPVHCCRSMRQPWAAQSRQQERSAGHSIRPVLRDYRALRSQAQQPRSVPRRQEAPSQPPRWSRRAEKLREARPPCWSAQPWKFPRKRPIARWVRALHWQSGPAPAQPCASQPLAIRAAR